MAWTLASQSHGVTSKGVYRAGWVATRDAFPQETPLPQIAGEFAEASMTGLPLRPIQFDIEMEVAE